MINEKEFKEEVTGLLKNEQSLDINGIMKLATNLLKDDDIMNTVSGIMKLSNVNPENEKEPEKEALTEEGTYSTEMNSFLQEMLALKSEIKDIKKQNEELKTLILKTNKHIKDVKKRHA
ncbi:hypothetical protein [Ammoniphilus sp. 3BR4]|uniref:hypothetical protein n=1 Tax=Ammoniphilus sp. 3BR4 TaxID=3158265 RepID=UPI003466537B